ncbi:ribonuclease H-like domain-containing protein [Bacillus tianshenii]|nr:ribonuclease H-like domain-containing protein [Bacillus tianshenii]
MSLKTKLKRLKSHMSHHQSEPKPTEEKQPAIPYLNEWESFQTKAHSFENETILIRDVTYPLDYQHGSHRFSELLEVFRNWRASRLEHPLNPKEQAAEDLLFFDTETTGLAGTGTTIFLLGCAFIEGNHVRLKQYLLPTPGAEAALYAHFLNDVKGLTNLVTYNGKAFDWPQVKTRHTLLRDIVPELPKFGHFDLLHAARRFWKHELDNVRLSTVEEKKLGLERTEDVPGYLAPMIYFDFLKDPNPRGIKGVMVHNEKDILSLITLYIHLSQKILQTKPMSDREQYELARWMEQVGEQDKALAQYETLTHSTLNRQAKLKQAMLYKKQKAYENACRLWEELLTGQAFIDETVAIELAKVCEHQFRDYEKAIYYTELAYSSFQQKKQLLSRTKKLEDDKYDKRLRRLTKKLQKSQFSN